MGTQGIQGEYTGFTFNGVKTSDLGITRVSGGDRYKGDLLPSFEDKVVTVPGGDGSYYFGSLYRNREFSFSIAYDGVTDVDIRHMRKLFSDRHIHELIIDEMPYKIYYARIKDTPEFEYIAFDEGQEDYTKTIWTSNDRVTVTTGATERIYKGEATINFVCYEPFAHCKNKELKDYPKDNLQWAEASQLRDNLDGYDTYTTSGIFIVVSPKSTDNPKENGWYQFKDDTNERVLTEDTTVDKDKTYFEQFEGEGIKVYNPGDVPAHLKLTFGFESNGTIPTTQFGMIEDGETFSFKFTTITKKGEDEFVIYDSKLHLLYGFASGDATGNVYNEYIDAGDFFGVPVSIQSPDGNVLQFTSKSAKPIVINYDYLYF